MLDTAGNAGDSTDSIGRDPSASGTSGLVARLIAWILRVRLVRAFLHYTEHRGPLLADSITYRALFSVFAGVLLGFSIAGLWLAGNPDAWDALLAAVDSAIPGLLDIVSPEAAQLSTGLTVAGIVSLVGLVGAAIGAIGSLRTALRTIADQITDDMFFVWVLLRNLALAIGIGLALAASAAATFAGTAFLGILADWFGLAESSPAFDLAVRGVGIVATFLLDAAVVAAAFLVLSGVRPRPWTLIRGALLGGLGLTVLQQLSGLFVGGANANPLLTTFASLIALLLWFNLSAQVILIASAYIVVGVEEDEDRVRARFGAATFAQRRVLRAERAVDVAAGELAAAREGAAKERDQAAKKAAQRA